MDSMNLQHRQHHHHQNHQLHHQHHLQQQQLIQAVKDCNLSQVDELLNQGVSVDARDEDGCSLLYWACCRGYVDICRRLLRRGCDVTSKGKTGTTALMACADNGHETCLTFLLQHRSIRLDDISDRGDTALHMAAYRGFHSIVHLLCRAGANPGLHNINGHTPLAVAHIQGHKDCIQVLKSYGQDYPECLNKIGSPSASGQRNLSCPEFRLLPSPASTERSKSHPTDGTPSLPNLDHHEGTVFKSTSNDYLLSSDSALGFSVHSPPSSSHFDSADQQKIQHKSTPLPSNCTSAESYSDHNPTYCLSHGHDAPSRNRNNVHTFIKHLHSPIENDERPFLYKNVLSNSSPPVSAHQNSHCFGNEHPDSGHYSSGSNGHYDPNVRAVLGNESSGYYSSNTKDKKDNELSSNAMNYNSFQGSFSPSIDPIYPPSFTFTTSGEDTSGPPAICYSPRVENDHVKSIYCNAVHSNTTSPIVVSSANKRKYSVNNLSSQSKRNEDNLKDVSNYNIVSVESSPAEVFVKSQNFNSKEHRAGDTEVLPGLKMSSYLDSLQMKVVMLEDSLDKEKNENRKLKEENMDLREVVQQLTQKLSKLS